MWFFFFAGVLITISEVCVCYCGFRYDLSHFGLKASQRTKKYPRNVFIVFLLLIKMQFVLQIPEHFRFVVASMRSFFLPIWPQWILKSLVFGNNRQTIGVKPESRAQVLPECPHYSSAWAKMSPPRWASARVPGMPCTVRPKFELPPQRGEPAR